MKIRQMGGSTRRSAVLNALIGDIGVVPSSDRLACTKFSDWPALSVTRYAATLSYERDTFLILCSSGARQGGTSSDVGPGGRLRGVSSIYAGKSLPYGIVRGVLFSVFSAHVVCADCRLIFES